MEGTRVLFVFIGAAVMFAAPTAADHGHVQGAAVQTTVRPVSGHSTLPTTRQPAVTSTATSTTATPCFPIELCMSDTLCRTCLAGINASAGVHSFQQMDALGHLQDYQQTGLAQSWLKSYEVAAFDGMIDTPACYNASYALLGDALAQITLFSTRQYQEQTCFTRLGMVLVTYCPLAEYNCFLQPLCRQCWKSVVQLQRPGNLPRSGTEVVRTPACRRSMMENFADQVPLTECKATYPYCARDQMLCETLPNCPDCLTTLRNGDGAGAARQCPHPTDAAALLDSLVTTCTFHTDVGCAYEQARCNAHPNCSNCVRSLSMSKTISAAEFARELNSPTCQAMVANEVQLNRHLLPMSEECWPKSSCQARVVTLLSTDGVAALPCLEGLQPQNPHCTARQQKSGIDIVCRPCASSIDHINSIVLATCVVGGVSVVVCFWVVITIVAHGRASMSMRDRIVIGLMVTNGLYSIANALPLNMLHVNHGQCGQLELPFATMRWGRASWFAGKFGLVAYEWFIVGASMCSLRCNAFFRARAESVLHTLCGIVCCSAFAAFYLSCERINSGGYNEAAEMESFTNAYDHLSNESNDDLFPAYDATLKFDAGRAQYNLLVSQMLLLWNVLAGVAVAMWIAVRIMYLRALSELRLEHSLVDAAQARDDWVITRRSEWKARRAILIARRQAYADVAIPLEPYLLLFILFLIPAVVMSTEYCQEQSAAKGVTVPHVTFEVTYGICDVGCELALAFRSLFTAGVYLSQRARRIEFTSVATTCCKLWKRAVGSNEPEVTDNPDVDYDVELLALDSGSPMTPPRAPTIPAAPWHVALADYEFRRSIGQGGFARVWSARWLSCGKSVAIKVFSNPMLSEEGNISDPAINEEFRREVQTLIALDHPHVLKVFGFGTTEAGTGFIVTELMTGSLDSALHDDALEFPWRDRVSVGLQVALGMQYLHDMSMVHRDLKSANILLSDNDANLVAKICDFGLARITRRPKHRVAYSPFTGIKQVLPVLGDLDNASHSAPANLSALGNSPDSGSDLMTKRAGTLPWMAPEVFRGDRTYGKPSDVYSYGILLSELATRRSPWTELGFQSELAFTALLCRALQSGQRPRVPASIREAVPKYMRVMQLCWEGDPADRPRFSDVTAEMAQCLTTEATLVFTEARN